MVCHPGPHLRFGLLPPARRRPAGSVLTGDTILGRGTTVLDYPDGTLGDYLASLDRLERLGPATVLPAHGPVLPALDAVVRAYRDHRLDRLAQIRAALAGLGGDAAVAEVTRRCLCRRRSFRPARGREFRGGPAGISAPWTGPDGDAAREPGRDCRLGTMRIARFVVDSDPLYGVVEGQPGSEEITVINGDPFFNGVERTPSGTSWRTSACWRRSFRAAR